jgi:hypothetical protein
MHKLKPIFVYLGLGGLSPFGGVGGPGRSASNFKNCAY